MRIYHYDIVKNSKLGFGDRLVFWLSGCPFNCKGCIAENFLDINKGKNYLVDDLVNIINNTKCDGITFSGGEPLLQYQELLELMERVNKDSMLFTGYYKYELNEKQFELFNKFDLVVEGRFEIEKRGSFLWRGSSNQIISSPTRKYDTEKLNKEKNIGLEVVLNDKEFYFYGIPTDNNEIEIIEKKLSQNGINIKYI